MKMQKLMALVQVEIKKLVREPMSLADLKKKKLFSGKPTADSVTDAVKKAILKLREKK